MIRKLITVLSLILLSLAALSGQDGKKVAIVKMVRGDASFLNPDGEKDKIKKDMWLKEGAIVTTSEKSFVKLAFIDKSSMNVGPKSELKIEKFSKNEAGVINVLTGKIRSKVTKDYLDMDKDKSKLFIKSRNAVMGVRGTDFLFSANKTTGSSTAVLFEGSIVFNKISKESNMRDLESIVNKGRKIQPGQVSVAMRGIAKPTVPAKMSKKQFETLSNNDTFKVVEVKSEKKVKSVVPPGLTGDIVVGENTELKKTINEIMKVELKTPEEGKQNTPTADSKGFVNGDDIKPADGVVVHIDSGMVIPPGSDSTFDKNTGEWVSSTNGNISSAGDYIPPQGFAVNDDGQMLKMDTAGNPVEVVVMQIMPVDKMPTMDKAPTVEYIAPKVDDKSKGPAPAGSMDEVKDAFNMTQEEIIKEEIQIEKAIELEKPILRDPSGDPIIGIEDSSILPPPPLPTGTGTIKPPTFTTDGGTPPPPPPPVTSGKGKIQVQFNKK